MLHLWIIHTIITISKTSTHNHYFMFSAKQRTMTHLDQCARTTSEDKSNECTNHMPLHIQKQTTSATMTITYSTVLVQQSMHKSTFDQLDIHTTSHITVNLAHIYKTFSKQWNLSNLHPPLHIQSNKKHRV